MPERSYALIPYLTVRNLQAAVAFYSKAFGFERQEMAGPPGSDPIFASMAYQGQTVLMLSPQHEDDQDGMEAPTSSGQPPPLNLYLYCENVDALFSRAQAAGAQVKSPPTDMPWGDRVAQLIDPDGYFWTFARQLGEDEAGAPAAAEGETAAEGDAAAKDPQGKLPGSPSPR